jgi:dTDP-4-dehydrorhamnose reductase
MFLLAGGDSEIGAAAARHLRDRGIAVAATTRRPARVGHDRPLLDLSAPLEGWEPPAGTTAACIIAAIPRIAACEDDPVGSAFINVDQTFALADRLLGRGAAVLFLSTNQVFDGSQPLVRPGAPTCPVSAYGRQKARTEAGLLERAAAGLPVAVLRLTKVVSLEMPLLQGWAKDLGGGRPVRAFSDMMMAPVPIALVSQAIAALLGDRTIGIFQLSGPRDVTYADIARHIARRVGADERLVEAVSAPGMPAGATPFNTTLDSTLLRDRYGIAVPDAFEVVDEVLAFVPARSARA